MSEQEWRERYAARLTQRGLDAKLVKETTAGAEFTDGDPDPEEAADDEITYLAEG